MWVLSVEEYEVEGNRKKKGSHCELLYAQHRLVRDARLVVESDEVVDNFRLHVTN